MLDDRQPEVAAVSRMDEVTAALAGLGEVLGTEEDLGRALQHSVEMLVRAVPGADLVSVSVLRGDSAETVASSSERVWAIDSDQAGVAGRDRSGHRDADGPAPHHCRAGIR